MFAASKHYHSGSFFPFCARHALSTPDVDVDVDVDDHYVTTSIDPLTFAGFVDISTDRAFDGTTTREAVQAALSTYDAMVKSRANSDNVGCCRRPR